MIVVSAGLSVGCSLIPATKRHPLSSTAYDALFPASVQKGKDTLSAAHKFIQVI